MLRYYLLPEDRISIGGQDYRGPKYLKWHFNESGLDVVWNAIDHDSIFLTAVEADAATHTTLAAYPDTYQLPELGSGLVGIDGAAIRNFLTANGVEISSHIYTITGGTDLIKVIAGMFLANQRKRSRYPSMTTEEYDSDVAEWRVKPIYMGTAGQL